MKYLHPDVIDNGPAYIASTATRALLLHGFSPGMDYAQALASALFSAIVSSADFTLSDEGTGRKLVFSGATGIAAKSSAGQPLCVALTDGASRLLLVTDEASHIAVFAGTKYRIPAITYVLPQPQTLPITIA